MGNETQAPIRRGLPRLNAPGTRTGLAGVVLWKSEVRIQWKNIENTTNNQ